jgi:hypothetical protein
VFRFINNNNKNNATRATAEMEAESKSTCRLLRFKLLALHEHFERRLCGHENKNNIKHVKLNGSVDLRHTRPAPMICSARKSTNKFICIYQ